MDPAKAAKKISSLRAQIAHHNELYYRQAKPEISDFDYDRMKRELAELEEQFPTLAVPEESPSEQIGDDRLEGCVTYPHRHPTQSLDTTYSAKEFIQLQSRPVPLSTRSTT